jgi:hypothetical protein
MAEIIYLYCHNDSNEDVFVGQVCSRLLKTGNNKVQCDTNKIRK